MNVLATLKDLPGAVVDLIREIVQRIESEYLLALLGIAVATIVTILLLPAEMSTDRYVVAIVALVGILIAVLFVLVTLARDRRSSDQQLRAKEEEIARIRTESQGFIERKEAELARLQAGFDQYRAQDAAGDEQRQARLASETALLMIVFGEQLLELDVGPADRRKLVLEGMTSYLGRLIENATAAEQQELVAWLATLVAVPQQELERRGAMQVVREGVG
jgi:uncharacterized membrane protein YgaE (UPF0421/DUF939 family)